MLLAFHTASPLRLRLRRLPSTPHPSRRFRIRPIHPSAHPDPRASPPRHAHVRTLATPAMTTALSTPSTLPSSVVGRNPVFAQCMLRITDPIKSTAFYEALGMKHLTRLDFASATFSLFFFAYTTTDIPLQSRPQAERAAWLWSRPEPTIELTWNWPRETLDESLRVCRESGAATESEALVTGDDTQGFSHVAIGVSDVSAAAAMLRSCGYEVDEAVVDEGVVGDGSDGKGRHAAATVKDPDGYHMRLVGQLGRGAAVPLAQLDAVYDSVALRIHDPRSALGFFTRLGYRLLARDDDERKQTTEYLLAYTESSASGVEEVRKMRECKVSLVHKWGSEEESSEVIYGNGNVKGNRGFGHIGIIVDDIYGTMDELTKEGYSTIRKAGPFQDAGELAFIEEPSTKYWVEIIKRAGEARDAPYAQP